jgi:hypothetical protein
VIDTRENMINGKPRRRLLKKMILNDRQDTFISGRSFDLTVLQGSGDLVRIVHWCFIVYNKIRHFGLRFFGPSMIAQVPVSVMQIQEGEFVPCSTDGELTGRVE